jgi:hypothetical protein
MSGYGKKFYSSHTMPTFSEKAEDPMGFSTAGLRGLKSVK